MTSKDDSAGTFIVENNLAVSDTEGTDTAESAPGCDYTHGVDEMYPRKTACFLCVRRGGSRRGVTYE